MFMSCICLGRKLVRLSAKNHGSFLSNLIGCEDNKLLYYLFGIICSSSIFLENKSRRTELALYVLPKGYILLCSCHFFIFQVNKFVPCPFKPWLQNPSSRIRFDFKFAGIGDFNVVLPAWTKSYQLLALFSHGQSYREKLNPGDGAISIISR